MLYLVNLRLVSACFGFCTFSCLRLVALLLVAAYSGWRTFNYLEFSCHVSDFRLCDWLRLFTNPALVVLSLLGFRAFGYVCLVSVRFGWRAFWLSRF